MNKLRILMVLALLCWLGESHAQPLGSTTSGSIRFEGVPAGAQKFSCNQVISEGVVSALTCDGGDGTKSYGDIVLPSKSWDVQRGPIYYGSSGWTEVRPETYTLPRPKTICTVKIVEQNGERTFTITGTDCSGLSIFGKDKR